MRLPVSSLGPERAVHLGKSVEGVLRHRAVSELRDLFRRGYVCIRRFRTTDQRLLPLVLDPPRLLKYQAAPSEVAVQARPTEQRVGSRPTVSLLPPPSLRVTAS